MSEAGRPEPPGAPGGAASSSRSPVPGDREGPGLCIGLADGQLSPAAAGLIAQVRRLNRFAGWILALSVLALATGIAALVLAVSDDDGGTDVEALARQVSALEEEVATLESEQGAAGAGGAAADDTPEAGVPSEQDAPSVDGGTEAPESGSSSEEPAP